LYLKLQKCFIISLFIDIIFFVFEKKKFTFNYIKDSLVLINILQFSLIIPSNIFKISLTEHLRDRSFIRQSARFLLTRSLGR